MNLQQALDASRTLAKHNPFVRMTDGFDRSRRPTPDEQKLANQASAILTKAANKAATPLVPLCTEELQDLMNNEKYKALF